MAHFDGDLIERAADQRKGRDICRMAVALDHLRGNGGGLQSQPLADALFMFRLQVAECADGSREFAHAHVFRSRVKAHQVALHLSEPVQQLETESCGFGMNAMRAADGGRVLEFEGAALEDRQERSQAVANEIRRRLYLQSLRGIDNVVRGEPIVRATATGHRGLYFLAISATAVVKAMTSCLTSDSIS